VSLRALRGLVANPLVNKGVTPVVAVLAPRRPSMLPRAAIRRQGRAVSRAGTNVLTIRPALWAPRIRRRLRGESIALAAHRRISPPAHLAGALVLIYGSGLGRCCPLIATRRYGRSGGAIGCGRPSSWPDSSWKRASRSGARRLCTVPLLRGSTSATESPKAVHAAYRQQTTCEDPMRGCAAGKGLELRANAG
jgi:hypothetical protein